MEVAAADDLHVGAGLVQKHGRLAGALAAPDHGNALAAEGAEVVVFAGMARKCCGHLVEYGRAELLMGKPGGDDDAVGADGIAVRRHRTEAVPGGFHPLHHAPVDVGNGTALEPDAVVDEGFELERLAPRQVML